jgi:hypothetical protein
MIRRRRLRYSFFSIGHMTSNHTHIHLDSQPTGAAGHVQDGFFWRQAGKVWSTAHTNFADTLQTTFDGRCTLVHRYRFFFNVDYGDLADDRSMHFRLIMVAPSDHLSDCRSILCSSPLFFRFVLDCSKLFAVVPNFSYWFMLVPFVFLCGKNKSTKSLHSGK